MRDQSAPRKERLRGHVVRHWRIFSKHRILKSALPSELNWIVHPQTEWLRVSDPLVRGRFGDSMIAGRVVVDRECIREALHARGIRFGRSVRFSRVATGL